MSTGTESSLASTWPSVGQLFRQTWVLWILPTVLGILVGAWAGEPAPPVYEAATTVLVLQSPGADAVVDYTSILATKQLLTTLEAMVRSNRVVGAASASLDPPQTVESLRSRLRVTVPRDTVLLQISVQAARPDTALSGVQAVTFQFIMAAREAFPTMKIRLTDDAAVSSSPGRPNRPLLWIVGGATGAALGSILALWWYTKLVTPKVTTK